MRLPRCFTFLRASRNCVFTRLLVTLRNTGFEAHLQIQTRLQELCELPRHQQEAVLGSSQLPLPLQVRLLPEAVHEAALHAAHPSIANTSYISPTYAWDCSEQSSSFWQVLGRQTQL